MLPLSELLQEYGHSHVDFTDCFDVRNQIASTLSIITGRLPQMVTFKNQILGFSHSPVLFTHTYFDRFVPITSK